MILAADNINPMNPVIASAIEKLDPGPVREIARRCVKAGAEIIDINPGHLSARRIDRIDFLVDAVRAESDARLIIDSPDPAVVRHGLDACGGEAIVSAVTLEKTKLEGILPLAAELGLDTVLLLIDDRSVSPRTADEKIAVAIQLWQAATEAGLDAGKLIFDPVLPNMTWHDSCSYLSESIKTVRMLSSGSVLGEPARTMAGISNLMSGRPAGFPDSLPIDTLAALAGAGLDIALANAISAPVTEAFQRLARLTS